jgi:hypothetical protein
MDNFSMYEWRQNLLLKEAQFDPKKSDLNKDGKLSGYEKNRGIAVAKNMDEVQFGKEFSFTDDKWTPDPNNPNKKVPKAIAFNYSEIKDIVGGENIKLVAKTLGKNTRGRGAGRDKKEFVMYISKDLKTALDQLTRGRTSRQIEKGKFDLTKKLSNMPSAVRSILKKGTDGAKLMNFGTTPMYQVNWPIMGQSMHSPNIYWLATKNWDLEEAVPFKKNALGEEPAKLYHDALDLEEHDWKNDPKDESGMISVQLKSIIDLAQALLQMNRDGNQYDAWVQSKITKAQDYLQSVHDYHKYEDHDANEID